ncbi:MAG TPA: hypothetical protein VFD80_05250 [Flavobacteriaceae bacterium]|nr:hypothetical protein [Flavobacteriaceae bacterium]
MKNIKFLLICSLVLLISSCSSDDDSGGFDGSTGDIKDFVTPELYDIMTELGLVIHTGNTPPLLEGGYYMSPCILSATNIETDNIGAAYASQTFYLSNMNADNLTIDYAGGGGSQQDDGSGSFISGSGNDFSIFLTITSEISGYEADTVFVLSGTETNDGFVDFQLAVFMKDNNGNPGGVFIEDGKGRIFIDGDELVEKL